MHTQYVTHTLYTHSNTALHSWLTHIYITAVRLTHIHINTVRLTQIHITTVRLTHIHITTVRLTHTWVTTVRFVCVEDNAHVPCPTGNCKAHNIRYTDILTDVTVVTHSSVCTYEALHYSEALHYEVSHT